MDYTVIPVGGILGRGGETTISSSIITETTVYCVSLHVHVG